MLLAVVDLRAGANRTCHGNRTTACSISDRPAQRPVILSLALSDSADFDNLTSIDDATDEECDHRVQQISSLKISRA